MNPANIFKNIPLDLKQESFEKIGGTENIVIERIVSKGHSSPESGWHQQDKSEWVILLQGSAQIVFFEGDTITLTIGDYIQIPPNKKHRVTWTDPNTESIWLAIHYND